MDSRTRAEPAGSPAAGIDELRELSEPLYAELRAQAKRQLRQRFGRATAGLTWQPTALVNETLLRLLNQRQDYESRSHFLALATTVMKRLVVDYIRERVAQKRGGGLRRVEFDPDLHGPSTADENAPLDVEAMFQAVERLAVAHPRRGDVARLRLAWGYTSSQIATCLNVSDRSVERDWRFARAWIVRELSLSGEHCGVPRPGEHPSAE